jgi:hypothetical protein
MKLLDLSVPTAVATGGMHVDAVFRECIAKKVPGIPFRDATGKIVGKASIRHVLKMNCIPDFMVKHAALLGDHLERLMVPAEKAHNMLALPIDAFVLPDVAMINSEAPIFKALAVMERHDTTYLFVIDGNEYHGTVSIMGIGEAVLAYGGI